MQLSPMEKERILNKESLHELKRKLITLFKEKCTAQTRLSEAQTELDSTAQTRLSEAQAELDRRVWERRNADVALSETGRQLESQRMELSQANQLCDQAQSEKSWLYEDFLNRKQSLFKKIVQGNAERLKNCEEFAVLSSTLVV